VVLRNYLWLVQGDVPISFLRESLDLFTKLPAFCVSGRLLLATQFVRKGPSDRGGWCASI
jgi:hypothetical protein